MPQEDLGFSFILTNSNAIIIYRDRKQIAIVGGKRAPKLRAKLDAASFAEQQQLLARATGNYKRGNERASQTIIKTTQDNLSDA